ncbi:MAG: hypothetical protein WC969_10430 [Elusimicrobiota bacterium]|jgi:hypothetical protein
MKSAAVLFFAFLWASPASAERYKVSDEGGFGSTGRFVELSSRFGWESYEVRFEFSLEPGERVLGNNSKLEIAIKRRDGSRWRHRCRVDEEGSMKVNINPRVGGGTSVLVECAILPKLFAKAVGVPVDLVGEPTLVFHAIVEGKEARAGVQKGFYFLPSGQSDAGPMGPYLSPEPDPANLGCLFSAL